MIWLCAFGDCHLEFASRQSSSVGFASTDAGIPVTPACYKKLGRCSDCPQQDCRAAIRALDQGALGYSIHVDMFTLHRETQARSIATAGLADNMKRARTSCLVGQDLEVRPQLLLELTCSALTQV